MNLIEKVFMVAVCAVGMSAITCAMRVLFRMESWWAAAILAFCIVVALVLVLLFSREGE
jgi:hypothetical protein